MTTCETPLSGFSIVPRTPDCFVVVEQDWLLAKSAENDEKTYNPLRIFIELLACLGL
jgi:hypothetical protein